MAIALLTILVVATLLSDYYVPLAGRRARLEHLVGPAAFMILVVWQAARRRMPVRADLFTGLAAAWVTVNAVSSLLYSPQLPESAVHVVRMALLMAIFLTIANLPFQSGPQWVRGLRLWLALGLVEIAYGLLIWLLARFADVWLPGAYLHTLIPGIHIKGTQYERNLFGILAATLLFVVAYAFLAGRTLHRQVLAPAGLLGAGAMLAAIVTVLSLTRSAWLAVVVTGPLGWMLFDRRRWGRVDRPLRQAIVGLPLVLAVLIGGVRLIPEPDSTASAPAVGGIETSGRATGVETSGRATGVETSGRAAGAGVNERVNTIGRLGSDFTTVTRVMDAKWAISDWMRSPLLGHGTGSFSQIHGMRAGTEAWISNLILHTLVDTGIVGLAIQLTLVVLAGHRAWRAATLTGSTELAIGLKALTLALILVLVAYQITDGSWLGVFWVHLGLMVSGIYRVNDELRGRAAAVAG